MEEVGRSLQHYLSNLQDFSGRHQWNPDYREQYNLKDERW
jgi:hypothetical protein